MYSRFDDWLSSHNPNSCAGTRFRRCLSNANIARTIFGSHSLLFWPKRPACRRCRFRCSMLVNRQRCLQLVWRVSLLVNRRILPFAIHRCISTHDSVVSLPSREFTISTSQAIFGVFAVSQGFTAHR